MSLILCIETGTDVCSVALARDGENVSLIESDQSKSHAGKLAVYVNDILRENNLDADELSAVAVAMGPGSYTGLRIGVSLAKGMCYSLGIPLLAIDSLYSMMRVCREDFDAGILDIDCWDRAIFCPMIDARRMEVYTEVFDAQLNPLRAVSAEVITADSFGQYIDPDGEFVIFGNGAAKCLSVLPAQGVKYVNVTPSARGLAEEAQRRLDASQVVDIAYFEPFYLKDFVVTQSKKNLFKQQR